MSWYNRIKIILRNLKGNNSVVADVDRFWALKSSRNLNIGERTDISNLSVSLLNPIPNFVNIEIGDDCILSGTIVLHSNKSRVKIGDRVFIGPDTVLFCYESIEIENDVMVSWGCTLIDTNAHSLNSEERISDVIDWQKGPAFKNWSKVLSSPITIKSNCWIGFNCIVMKGVYLNKGTVVAAGSVVTKSSEEFSVIGGNPAVFIKHSK